MNEQAGIAGVLASVRRPGVECVVVDGGSRDGTAELARRNGADQVLASPPGRGAQLDAGYRASKGAVVLFLHADTRLEPGWDAALLRALDNPEVAGGAFRLRFDGGGAALQLVEWGARLRARLLSLPYGDQALFARRAVLDQIGGIGHVPLFEDLDLVRGIRRSGQLALLEEPAWTSDRRYREHGVLRVAGRNLLALLAWRLGLDRERVAAWYRRSVGP